VWPQRGVVGSGTQTVAFVRDDEEGTVCLIVNTVLLIGMSISYLTYGLLFPLCWEVYYERHPPEDPDDEGFGLVFVGSSLLCAATTLAGVVAKPIDGLFGGRYLFYSVIFGAVVVIQSTLLLVDGKSPKQPRGLRLTKSLGMLVGLAILTLVNATVILSLVPSF